MIGRKEQHCIFKQSKKVKRKRRKKIHNYGRKINNLKGKDGNIKHKK